MAPKAPKTPRKAQTNDLDFDLLEPPPLQGASPRPRKPRQKQPEPVIVKKKPKLWQWLLRGFGALFGTLLFFILLFSFVNPPTNIYQMSESRRLGGITSQWVDWDDIAPIMGRSAVAAEDANFCRHWGFDMAAIRQAVAQGGTRGASTISQQVVKNVFLWQGRSWLRKAMEGVITPVLEVLWSKQRILEVYLNIAEFDEGVFGVQAAAQHYFGVDARKLTQLQAARLAAILPDPKDRSASHPSNYVRSRTRAIISGAETIQADGRAKCFQG